VNFEMFQDKVFYNMYAVRPVGDKNYNSPLLFHFNFKKDAEKFLELIEGSFHVSNLSQKQFEN